MTCLRVGFKEIVGIQLGDLVANEIFKNEQEAEKTQRNCFLTDLEHGKEFGQSN